MRKLELSKTVRVAVALGAVLSMSAISQVSAQMSSGSYQVNEAQFGSGSSVEQCSGSYCSNASLGDLTNGSGSSTNYSAQFGFNTTDEPLLEVSVTQTQQDMGILSAGTTGTASATVSVRSYLSKGYVMQITGSAPRNGPKTVTNMATAATSQQGVEQFGMNLVANTTPSLGSNPVQVPDGSFSFGSVASGYNTPNQFKYVDGDVVAISPTSSGRTDYTISMIMNISDVTAGGQYQGVYSSVVVPMY